MTAGISLCTQCASQGKTCCQGTRVFLTGGDIQRITEHCPGEEFVGRAGPEAPPPDAFLADPAWVRLLAAESRAVLLHRPDGSCHFLDDGGCRLPMAVRPLICRLYPFEYDATTIKGVNPHLCPADARRNAPLLLALLGMNRDAAEEWRKLFYAENGFGL